MKLIFTQEEANAARKIIGELRTALEGTLNQDDESALWQCFKQSVRSGQVVRDIFGLNPLLQALLTASVAVEDTGLRRDGVVAILLYKGQMLSSDVEIAKKQAAAFGPSVEKIISGLLRIQDLNKKTPVIESENFRNLLLSFAEDMRVILIMIAERVNLMRQIRDT